MCQRVEAGSPKNRLGSRQRRDMDQGPFSPSTSELDLTLSACAKHNAYVKYPHKAYTMTDDLKFKNTGQHLTCFTKAG